MAPCKSGLLPEGLPCINNNIEIENRKSNQISLFYTQFWHEPWSDKNILFHQIRHCPEKDAVSVSQSQYSGDQGSTIFTWGLNVMMCWYWKSAIVGGKTAITLRHWKCLNRLEKSMVLVITAAVPCLLRNQMTYYDVNVYVPIPVFTKLLVMCLFSAYSVVSIACEGVPSMCTPLFDSFLLPCICRLNSLGTGKFWRIPHSCTHCTSARYLFRCQLLVFVFPLK